MNKYLKLSVFFLGLIYLAGACAIQQKEGKATTVANIKSKQPNNILFIAVDDLKPLLSNYGATQMHTPNFDRLAQMGMTFTNAHVQYAVCGPSRASIMTGTYPDRTKVWDLHTNFRQSSPSLISMPEYLVSQGYESTGVGKIYHKGSSSPGHDGASWTIPHSLPENYDSAYGKPAYSHYQNPATKARIAELEAEAIAKGKKKYGPKSKYVFSRIKPSTEAEDLPDEAYQDGLYTNVAIEKLELLAQGDKPWFLAVGWQKPHLPFVAPKKYWNLYDRDKIELAAWRKKSEGTPSLAYHSFGELRAYTDIDNDLGVGDELPVDKQRELIHGYMACVSYIDAQLGKLLDALETKGLTNSTNIVLWGDHGFHLGDHTLWCKHSNFEQATRIPFMFAGPGVAPGKTSNHPVELIDAFPTLFDLAGVAPSSQAEGKSLVPLLDTDPKTNIEQDYAISQYARRSGKVMGYSLRTDRYRYCEWHQNDFRSSKAYQAANILGVELYDYETDPNETKNLAKDPAYAEIVTQLQAKLRDDHLGNAYAQFNRP